MKLASLKSGRDGKLAIVSRDLTRAVLATDIAPTLQAALDDWERIAPQLAVLAERLEARQVDFFPFREADCAAPLPRAYQWADGSAYVNHVALVRKARGAEMPASFWTDPLMYQGGSDAFLGPRDPIPLPGDESLGLDLEAEVAVVTDDVPMGVTAEAARSHIRLVMLANDVTLRGLVAPELAKGFGFFQSKPPTAFSPVAVTPDELGAAWDGRKLAPAAPLLCQWRAARQAECRRGHDLRFRRADRSCGPNPPAFGWLDHRLGHRLEPWRGWRARQTDLGGRSRLFLSRRAAGRRNPALRRAAHAVP